MLAGTGGPPGTSVIAFVVPFGFGWPRGDHAVLRAPSRLASGFAWLRRPVSEANKRPPASRAPHLRNFANGDPGFLAPDLVGILARPRANGPILLEALILSA